ncbi:MAG: dihydroxyacetone kinase subunit DhaL [Candidatus Dormibacteria bacterium]|jgi:dihydroxyacetone kinase-like protein
MAITAEQTLGFIQQFGDSIAAQKDYLTELDSKIGDGDHGINMNRGMKAVLAKLDGATPQDISAIYKMVAMTLISTVGGASGPLYGTIFLQLGTATQGKSELSVEDWSTALTAAVHAVEARGKAVLQDKTMIDALEPAISALQEAVGDGDDLETALGRAEAAAEAGMKATIPLVARRGRASYLGERSAGHQDPGATSSWLLMGAAHRAFGDSQV